MARVTKAVVLAAGKGTRMGSLTEDLPKPMLEVAGKPLLEHVLDNLGMAGIEACCLIVGYRAEVIEQHFSRYPMRLTFVRQQTINGTAGAARLARDFAAGDPFLLTFGDIWCGWEDYRRVLQPLEDEAGTEAAIAVKYVDDPYQGAAVYETGGFVTRIIEKPTQGTSTTHWNSAGIHCYRAAAFDEFDRVPLSARGEFELTSAIESLVRQGRVRAVEILGAWRDVGRPEDLKF